MSVDEVPLSAAEIISDKGMYTFPTSVRLFNDISYTIKLTKRLEAEIGQSPTSGLYRSLVDVYRRTGDLVLASQVAESWQKFAPSDKCAGYLSALLAQQTLRGEFYCQSDIQPAPFFIKSNFLSVEERGRFMSRALNSEHDFRMAGMGTGDNLVVNRDRRVTEVIFLDKWEKENICDKVYGLAKEVSARFMLPSRPTIKVEAKLTAHRDGGFFNVHQDAFTEINGSSRHISWVYYFHLTPKPYRGGDLVLFDSTCQEENHRYNEFDYTRISPKDNQIVFFPSWFYHGVTPVSVLQSGFASSRFAVAGHIRY